MSDSIPSTRPAPGTSRDAASSIDASVRWPVLALATSATAWLLAGLLLSVITAIKLHAPQFLADSAWLTLGRVRPAALNCLLYGFAAQAGLAVALWIVCRGAGSRFTGGVPALAAHVLWNVAVTIGVIAILAGASTGFAWLEMPRAAAGLLLASLLLFSILILAVLQGRRSAELSPAQWFVLAALFWFAWSYSAANHLLLVDPVRGTLQSVVNGWFTGVFSHLTLGGLALASLYYFLPRLTERPLHSSGLAAFAFWNLVAFGGFTGLTGLIGSPVPRWIPAVSGAATVCLLLPLACHLGNWHWTVQSGKPGALAGAFGNKAPLGFLLVAVCSFALLGLLDAALSFPAVSERLNLTYFTTARQNLFLHGFVGAALLGGLQVILPAVVGAQWASPGLARGHLHLTVAGVAMVFASLAAAGLAQGARLADPSVPFIDVVKAATPFLRFTTLGLTVLLLGQLCFAANLARLVVAALDSVLRPACAAMGCCGESLNAGVKP